MLQFCLFDKEGFIFDKPAMRIFAEGTHFK
jgi:hypothetical protein